MNQIEKDNEEAFFEAKPINILKTYSLDRVKIEVEDNGAIAYFLDGKRIHRFFAEAAAADGRKISSNNSTSASMKAKNFTDEIGTGTSIDITYSENGLKLIHNICLYKGKTFIALKATLKSDSGEVESNYLAPVITGRHPDDLIPQLKYLCQWMYVAPYDNDFWARYEIAPFGSGRTSYDISAICSRDGREGLVIGAVDFENWKNAITCSSVNSYVFTGYSGAADRGTHDAIPHGTLKGETVSSSRFIAGWYDELRSGLEEYAQVCSAIHPPLQWKKTSPFGFNSYSGLGRFTDNENFREAGNFVNTLKDFHDTGNVTYVNVDGGWEHMFDQKDLIEYIKVLHARGQKAGCYDAPFMVFGDVNRPLPGVEGKSYKDILLYNPDGSLAPAIDDFLALDVSHPLWEKFMQYRINHWLEMGFDYVKIDFLSSGALEGAHKDPSIRTGRQAYNKAMRFFDDALSHEKTGKDFFISLSIAPVFPHGYGHARRECGDSFAYHTDVEYVLNAQTFSWWLSGPLYSFNDPDHLTLYTSNTFHLPDRNYSTFEEARSRYTTGIISGSVMLLSDCYGSSEHDKKFEEAKKRTVALTGNHDINELARKGRPFRPL
jgi:alpha-galactosidase